MAKFRDDTKLRKVERLRTRAEFKSVERKSDRHRSHHFLLFVTTNDLDWSRIGLTVSRKVGRAPTRNWWKRRLREVFRTNKHLIPVGFDVVVIVRPRSLKPSYRALEKELLDLIQKATEET